MSGIFTPPVCKLEALNHLFIELTAKNCNQRCKKCYIDFPLTKNVKDFIQVDKIKKALSETMDADLKCIYLTGAEPMTHPDFNTILRLCLEVLTSNHSRATEKETLRMMRICMIHSASIFKDSRSP